MENMDSQMHSDYQAMGTLACQAMEKKAHEGWLPGPAPLGYRNIVRNGEREIEVNEKESALVREAFDLIVHGGASMRKLQSFLASKGLVSKHGKPLGLGSLHYLLTNPFYAGLIGYKGELIQGKHKPLVTKDLFDKTQEKLAERTYNRTPGTLKALRAANPEFKPKNRG
jgi:site-specific DNA recombinase